MSDEPKRELLPGEAEVDAWIDTLGADTMNDDRIDPRAIPEDLIERAARAMCGFNDTMQRNGRMWADVKDPERGHWLGLAQAGLIAISRHIRSSEV